VDWELFKTTEPMKLNTTKSVKILVNLAQPHIRKNMMGTLNAFGKAFTKKDYVCLVLKVVDKQVKAPFEQSFSELFKIFNAKYPNHAECLIIKDYVPSIESLYKACDILFMLPTAEAFFLPAIEALAAGCVVITSNYGGQLDFLTKENSFLINGKMVRAPQQAQYWTPSVYSQMFQADEDEAARVLRDVVENLSDVKKNIQKPTDELKKKFSWDSVAETLISYCE
jgi:glycosyltransferase involved in cell wall biosynthesis